MYGISHDNLGGRPYLGSSQGININLKIKQHTPCGVPASA